MSQTNASYLSLNALTRFKNQTAATILIAIKKLLGATWKNMSHPIKWLLTH